MIFAIKPFEIHDGDGIRTTVFFKGCLLRCKWCHNPESFLFQKEIFFDKTLCKNCMRCTRICDANVTNDNQHQFFRENCILCGKCLSVCPSNAFEILGIEMTAEEIADETLKDEIFMKGSGGGVTFSGGEPLMQVDLCVEIAKILKKKGINIAIDTSGAIPRSSIDKILPYVDTFLFDIKAFNENVHFTCTGVSNRQILDNVLYVDSLGIPIEIRYPYIPTMNDSEVQDIAEFVKELKNVKCIRILPYHNYAQRKYDCLGLSYPSIDVPVPSKEEIDLIVKRMQDVGLKNVTVN